ncbi:MAG: MATE family efflux transporter [Gemmatimonadaceae bacterium]|nr:MATE family efflux transporter [Gemmatimonadaceae bacterium]
MPRTGGADVNLATDSLPRVVVQLGLPAVASALLLTAFVSLDSAWVGHFVGGAGLAAVSTSIFWIWMVVSMAEMVSVGLTAVASRRHGERRDAEAARAVGDALVFTGGLGIATAALGLYFLPRLFATMETPPAVTALGMQYLGTYLAGAPLIFGYFVVDAAFRAAGNTRLPFIMLVCATIIAAVLDPILITGWGPFPQLGVRGAALATIGVRGSLCVVGVLMLKHRGLVAFGAIEWTRIATIVRIGLPTAATGVVFSLIYVVMTRTTTRFGTPALAALGLGHRIESWMYMVGVGFGAAAAAIVGQNLGAGQPDRAARAGWLTLAMTGVPGVIACAALLLFPDTLAGLFSADAAVVAEASRYLQTAAYAQLVVSGETVLEGALGGAGWTLPPMITSTAITLARVPLAAWAAMHWGTTGIWWVISLTAIARALAMMGLWASGGWRRAQV